MSVETETAELIVVDEINTLAKFTDSNVVDSIIARHQEELKAFVPDVSTNKGRDEIASFAYRFRKSKTHFDKVGKDLKSEAQAQVKAVDTERKRFRDTCDTMSEEARQPLTDWEAIEKDRVENIHRIINKMKDLAEPSIINNLLPVEINQRIKFCDDTHMSNNFEEFDELANETKEASIKFMTEARDRAVKAEAEAIELAELRKKEQERLAKEAEETLIAQKKAEQERMQKEADLKAKQEAQEAIDKAEADKQKAEQDLVDERKKAEADKEEAINKERIRVSQEKEAEQLKQKEINDAKAKREADADHREDVGDEIATDLRSHLHPVELDPEVMHKLIMAMAQGKIRHLTINY